ncbi:hypothetical protein LTR85_007380 [Meristemomyces frigidus]|nr:hypothetical protein LTR85_007380 [Meristemomyces frigidus]
MQTAPAYTAVAARHTLQRPDPTPASAKPQKVSWSPDVRLYVQRAFEPDNAIPGIDLPMMQEKLKVVITQAAETGQLGGIDWSTYPLPQDLIKAERDQAAIYGVQNAILANINAPVRLPNEAAYPPGSATKKRKNGDVDMSDLEPREITPPWKKKDTKGALEDRITGKNKNKSKKEKKAEASRAYDLGASAEVLERRRQRFGFMTPEPSPFLSSRDDSPEAVPTGPLVGTCQKLEKSYFRLTAPPAPDTVRPLPVLEKALHHIRSKWRKEHNYNYACDQLKSLRQDLTVQHVQNELTVKVYEAHARIALEMKDLGEYNQCQTQLRALYKSNLGGQPEEFTAYRILYIIYTCNRADMNNVLADLTTADKQMPGVQHALKVRSALASGNYHKFFRLYNDTPFMGGYLLDMIIQRERIAAMASICRAYKPDVSLHFLAQELAFNDNASDDASDQDAGPRQCLDFLCQHGGEPFVERKDGGDVRFATGKAVALFEGAKAAAFRGIDIKGQI